MSPYEVHVVDEWTPDDQEPIGSKAKEWLRGPQDRRWLFKDVRGQDRERRPEGEDWAEKVVAELAHILAIPAAQVEWRAVEQRLDRLGGTPDHGTAGVVDQHRALDQRRTGGRQVDPRFRVLAKRPDVHVAFRASASRTSCRGWMPSAETTSRSSVADGGSR